MRAINHALTGALIGFTISEPLLAVPVAVGSHFICDMIPHYDIEVRNEQEKRRLLRSQFFRNLLYADAAFCVFLVLILGFFSPRHWVTAAVCAFAAASPDLLWLRRY